MCLKDHGKPANVSETLRIVSEASGANVPQAAASGANVSEATASGATVSKSPSPAKAWQVHQEQSKKIVSNPFKNGDESGDSVVSL